MVLAVPLLTAALLLSYRRSFWIAAVLGLLLVLLLGTSRRGWRMIVPALAARRSRDLARRLDPVPGADAARHARPVARAVEPRVERRGSLPARRARQRDRRDRAPSGRRGSGSGSGWRATERPLPVEHEDGRRYVHFALLWWWMKLGILGAVAFVALVRDQPAAELAHLAQQPRAAVPLLRARVDVRDRRADRDRDDGQLHRRRGPLHRRVRRAAGAARGPAARGARRAVMRADQPFAASWLLTSAV